VKRLAIGDFRFANGAGAAAAVAKAEPTLNVRWLEFEKVAKMTLCARLLALTNGNGRGKLMGRGQLRCLEDGLFAPSLSRSEITPS
jgi:hypothetical protein